MSERWGSASLRENIDTTTARGRLVFHLFGALAQFEREIIRDRTNSGLAAARARGRVGDRPRKLSLDQSLRHAGYMRPESSPPEEIGKVLGVSRTSIYRALCRERPAVAGSSVISAAAARPRRAGAAQLASQGDGSEHA